MSDSVPNPPEGDRSTPEEPALDSAGSPAADPSAAVPLFAPSSASSTVFSAGEWETVRRASRRNFLHNLYLVLGLALTAFTLTAWILVRVPAPFGLFSNGPQQVVSAQLRAVNRGDLRVAYDMFSDRYRQQVTFNEWHELIVTHWRMFHTEVMSSGQLAQTGSRATLEIHLRGADDKPYRARFTLIRVSGRWWVDDLHWSGEQDEDDTWRT